MKIEAAIAYDDTSPFSIEACELKGPNEGEVLVDIKACGICHTDLSVKSGKLPIELPAVLGHEGAGVVIEVGKGVKNIKEGDRVALTYGSCGNCKSCKCGKPPYCDSFAGLNFPPLNPEDTLTVSNGDKQFHGRFFSQSSFATHAVAKVENTIKIDDDLPFYIAGPMGCGIQTGAGAVLNVLKPTAGESIGIFGAGSVGLSGVMAAKIANCGDIVVIDINKSRLETAKKLGATMTINAAKENVLEVISEHFPNLLNYTFESTGNPSVSEDCFNSIARLGTGAYIAAPALGTGFNVDINMLVGFGRTIRGVVEGESIPSEFIPRLGKYYLEGLLPLDEIITTFSFSQINEAVAAIESGEAIKAVLVQD